MENLTRLRFVKYIRFVTLPLLFFFHNGWSQLTRIDGPVVVCPDELVTYTIEIGTDCTVGVSMSCEGCYDDSSTSSSITLRWVSGSGVTRRVNASAMCADPDGGAGGPGNPDPPQETPINSLSVTLRPSSNPLFTCPTGIQPGGSIATASTSIVTSTFPVNVNLNYQPSGSYTGIINRVRYKKDGSQFDEFTYCSSNFGTSYSIPDYGTYTFYVDVLDQCGFDWLNHQSVTITVVPACANDVNASVTVTGNGVSTEGLQPGEFKVLKDETYTVNVAGVTNFSQYYAINFDDIGTDGSYGGNTFSISKALGRYVINFDKSPSLGSYCLNIAPITIFLGGQNEVLEKENRCPVVLPDDFAEFGFPDVVTDNLVLQHFAGIVKSEYDIVVKPGITLELGAELVAIELTPESPSDDPDRFRNYIQSTTFNDYNEILGQSRSYFDDGGRATQTQYKNLTADVMMASQTLYDAQGRAALTTLPAATGYGNISTQQDECGIAQQVGSKLEFRYNPDFLSGYSYANFDLYTVNGAPVDKENNPDPIPNANPGTLGWYYSANNGSATGDQAKMNEDFVGATGFPYTRTLFHRDGTGEVKGAGLPGDQLRAGAGHTASTINESVSDTDPYLMAYLNIRETELNLTQLPIQGNFFQTTSLDANGKRAVNYTDKEGMPVVSLYYGDGSTPITKSYNFYDDASRLRVSVSPNGVRQYESAVPFANIDKTAYEYNHKGFLIKSIETDGGETNYVYRSDGSIRFSQNAEQENDGRYSYTHYDIKGRPIESGEYLPGAVAFNSPAMNAILENVNADGGLSDGVKRERIFTLYDQPDPNIPLGRTQRFVAGAVSRTQKENSVTSWYSYDDQGRLEWMIQDIQGLGVKTLDYRYGATGQVQEVAYQKGNADQFTHFYEYDKDGRLKKAFITRELLEYDKFGRIIDLAVTYNEDTGEIQNPGALEHQATYEYYKHGPLKRVVLAQKQDGTALQGIDYVYTVDGSLKTINNADPNEAIDPGGDGSVLNPNVQPDAFGMALDYYANDYTGESVSASGYDDQFNGLIKASRWHGPVQPDQQFAYAYQYDPRNQFKQADWGTVNAGSFTANPLNPYHESIGGYDENGNISTLKRNGNVLMPMSNFTHDFKYNYAPNSNRLMSITKGTTSEVLRSYGYNELGQMTRETIGTESKYVVYDVTGKVTGVYADDQHTQPITEFVYDDRGFRVSKTTFNASFAPQYRTWYVRDASGSVVTTYDENVASATAAIPIEVPVYGAGRLGLYKPAYGFTLYELTDHLGNVRAVVGEPLEMEFLATMESERNQKENDPMQEGWEGFNNVKPSATASFINHTTEQFTVDGNVEQVANPNEVHRINNRPLNELRPDPIGPGMMRLVHPGDVIDAEVFVKYANFNSSDNNIVGALAGFLTTAFTGAPTIDGAPIFDVVETPEFGALPAWVNLDDDQPRIFLNYLLFDKDFNLQLDPSGYGGFDFDQASVAAEIPLTDPDLHQHERLSIHLDIEKEGYIYIYVSNESDQNMDAYFDDLRVTHTYSNIAAGADFYPFGLAIKDREITRELYRHGYQGQFSEKDEETGWNHFELREYDPVIGRWTITDPYGQHWSPYMGMGNDPTYNIDPDGGYCDSCPATPAYDQYRQSSLTYLFSEYVGGDGAFLLLGEATVSAGMSQSAISAAKLGIYQGQEDFMNHPVTQGAMFAIGFFTGGSEAYLLGRLGSAATRFSKPVSQLTSSLTRASPNTIGKIGEAAVEGVDKVKSVVNILGRDRIPDGLTTKVITEVKNVKQLSFTRQLRDFHHLALHTERRFDLFVRPTTKLSGPLKEAIKRGEINLQFIPGIR